MQQTEQGLQAAIFDEPHLAAPKLVYADWLEEQGDARAGILRALVSGNVNEALKLAGIARRTHHHETMEPVLIKLPGWRLFAADCVERVLVTCPAIPGAEPARLAVAFARAGAGSKLEQDARSALNRMRSIGLTVDTYRLAQAALTMVDCVEYQDAEHGLPLVLDVAISAVSATVSFHVEQATSPGEIDSVSSHVYETECNWQLLRLCEYQVFEGPLTPVC